MVPATIAKANGAGAPLRPSLPSPAALAVRHVVAGGFAAAVAVAMGFAERGDIALLGRAHGHRDVMEGDLGPSGG